MEAILVIIIFIAMMYFSNKYPHYFMIFTILAMVFIAIAGCQAVKEVGGSKVDEFAQQKVDEWVALSGVEVQWGYVPEKYRGRGLDKLPTLGRFLDRGEELPFYISCFPQPATSYPRSHRSIIAQELPFVAVVLGMTVGWCNAVRDSLDDDRHVELYQLVYEWHRWALTRLQEAWLPYRGGTRIPLSREFRAKWVCAVDKAVQEYKQQNPGLPVDTEVLDWIKDNQLWNCRH